MYLVLEGRSLRDEDTFFCENVHKTKKYKSKQKETVDVRPDLQDPKEGGHKPTLT